MSIIDTDSARAWRIQLAQLRQELLSPVNALLGYAEILHEEASRNGRSDILPDMNRILSAARDLAGKVDRLNAGLAGRVFGAGAGARWRLDRRRVDEWGREWDQVGPRWGHKTS